MIDLRGLSRSGLSQPGRRGIALRLLLALLVIAAIAFLARDAGKEIVALEAWIASKGIMGAWCLSPPQCFTCQCSHHPA
jgi:hypothetical protein